MNEKVKAYHDKICTLTGIEDAQKLIDYDHQVARTRRTFQKPASEPVKEKVKSKGITAPPSASKIIPSDPWEALKAFMEDNPTIFKNAQQLANRSLTFTDAAGNYQTIKATKHKSKPAGY